MKVYQIWDETSVGPIFKNKESAYEYLLKEPTNYFNSRMKAIEELGTRIEDTGYPQVVEISVGDITFVRDR